MEGIKGAQQEIITLAAAYYKLNQGFTNKYLANQTEVFSSQIDW